MRITTVKHSLTELTCGKCGDKIRASRDEQQDVVDKRTGKKKRKKVRVLGDSYRWIKFNRGPKRIRCMKPACAFRASDMTTSDKLSRVYGAQETAEEAIAGWDPAEGIDDLKQALEDLATEIREVSDEYEESASNMEQAFPSGSSQIDEIREKSENLAAWADEIEAVDLEEWDGPEDDDDTEPRKCIACELNVEKADDGGWKHVHEGEAPEEEPDHEPEPEDAKNSSEQTREEWGEEQRGKAEEVLGNCPV